jgi:thiosulfate reductase cytochrome b subunit
MTVLLMSGLQIFNAHPALYWGEQSNFSVPVLALAAQHSASGQPVGITAVFGHPFDTTGVLGVSRTYGQTEARGFPAWATIPRAQWLAMGRRWHFFFAWILVVNGALYLLYLVISGHLRRGLLPSRRDLREIGSSVWDHMRLHFPKGEEAKRYNVLQRLSYLIVLFGLVPLLILAGLAMSPRIDAGFPLLVTVFGGRQSARTVHFLCAFGLLVFTMVHLVMVVLSGVWNNLRSMLTGWYAISDAGGRDAD